MEDEEEPVVEEEEVEDGHPQPQLALGSAETERRSEVAILVAALMRQRLLTMLLLLYSGLSPAATKTPFFSFLNTHAAQKRRTVA